MLLLAGAFAGMTPDTVAGTAATDDLVWVSASAGFTESTVYSFAIDPSNSSALYAGTWRGVFKSQDKGATWTIPTYDLDAYAGFYIYGIAIDPVTPTTLYAGSGLAGVFKSTTGGNSWVPSSTGMTNVYVSCLSMDPTISTTLFVGTSGGGIFRSLDGALTWEPASSGLPANANIRHVTIDPLVHTTIYTSTYAQGLFRSEDGGTSWTQIASPDVVPSAHDLAIDPTSSSKLYAATQYCGVYRSVDRGATWTHTALNSGYDDVSRIAIDPTCPSTLIAGLANDEGVFLSDDSGVTWKEESVGLTSRSVNCLAFDPTVPETVYAGTLTGNLFKAAITRPSTYTVTPTVAGPGSISPAQQTGIVSGGTATFTVTVPAGCTVFPQLGSIVGNTWTIDNVTQDMTPWLLFSYLPTGNIVHAELFDATDIEVDADIVENVALPSTTKWTATMQNYIDDSGLPVVNPVMEVQPSSPFQSWTPSDQWVPNDPTYYSYDPTNRMTTWHLPTLGESKAFTATAVTETGYATPGHHMARSVYPEVINSGITIQEVQVSFTLDEPLPSGTDHVTIQIGGLDEIFGDGRLSFWYVPNSSRSSSAAWTLDSNGQHMLWNANIDSLTVGTTYTLSQNVYTILTTGTTNMCTVKPAVVASVGTWREPAPYTSTQVTFLSNMFGPGVATNLYADDPVDWDMVFPTSRRTVTMKQVLDEVPMVPGTIYLAPPQISLKSNGMIQVFLSLPAPYTPADVVASSVLVCGVVPLDVRIVGTCLVAKLRVDQVTPVLLALQEPVVTCAGVLTNGHTFTASCPVTIH
jgi:photosystem II stability/assembly factor-like uncharacterized protein